MIKFWILNAYNKSNKHSSACLVDSKELIVQNLYNIDNVNNFKY